MINPRVESKASALASGRRGETQKKQFSHKDTKITKIDDKSVKQVTCPVIGLIFFFVFFVSLCEQFPNLG